MTTTSVGPSSSPGVLVIHPGTIGDVLLARSALKVLRNRFPNHQLGLIAAEAVGRLLFEGKEVDRLFPLEGPYLAMLYAGEVPLTSEFSEWLRTCGCAIGWLQDQGRRLERSLRQFGIQDICIKAPSSGDIQAIHQSSRFLAIATGQKDQEPDLQQLRVSAVRREAGVVLLKELGLGGQAGYVAVHVGSGSQYKCLDPLILACVVEGLVREGYAPLLLCGPADEERLAQVCARTQRQVPVLQGRDLTTVAGVLSWARLYLGHDSGLTHLAAGLGIPTVVCFGPTDLQRWRPLGSTVVAIEGGNCSCATWSDVQTCRDKPCLAISPERLVDACLRLLRGSASQVCP